MRRPLPALSDVPAVASLWVLGLASLVALGALNCVEARADEVVSCDDATCDDATVDENNGDDIANDHALLDVTLTIDFGRDEGQNFGSLFEVHGPDGQVVAGAGFLGAYNTQPRSDRRRLHFYLKPLQVDYQVETLPRVNRQTGVYLSQYRDRLYARSRSGHDEHFYWWNADTRHWQVDDALQGYDLDVAGKPLRVSDREVTYDGNVVLRSTQESPQTHFREHYYANGQLVIRVQAGNDEQGTNRLIAYGWSPYDSRTTRHELPLRSQHEFVYAFGQRGSQVLAATNTGGVYSLDRDAWRVLVEPAAHSYQVYAMLNYYDQLLLGHYPSGEILAYDGRELHHRKGWPPVMPGVSQNARETQTLAIYGGDLYAGVWPWAEVWRYDGNASQWRFARRMFTRPEPTDETTHPYERETQSQDAVLNLWGQRVTSMVPWRESLYVSTSSKGGNEYDAKFTFLDGDRWKEYGKVYRLTLPGQLSAQVRWSESPTTIRCVLTDDSMTIYQDGRRSASRDVAPRKLLAAQPARIAWGRGIYGPLIGKLLTWKSNFDEDEKSETLSGKPGNPDSN
jgi:hypothetical protein